MQCKGKHGLSVSKNKTIRIITLMDVRYDRLIVELGSTIIFLECFKTTEYKSSSEINQRTVKMDWIRHFLTLKLTLITLANHKGHNPINQSKLEVKKRIVNAKRGKTYEQVMLGFGFTSD